MMKSCERKVGGTSILVAFAVFVCVCVCGAGGGLVGALVPPSTVGSSSTSPGGSPTKAHSHSAHTSPTNTTKVRPRARSAESDSKKLVGACCR